MGVDLFLILDYCCFFADCYVIFTFEQVCCVIFRTIIRDFTTKHINNAKIQYLDWSWPWNNSEAIEQKHA